MKIIIISSDLLFQNLVKEYLTPLFKSDFPSAFSLLELEKYDIFSFSNLFFILKDSELDLINKFLKLNLNEVIPSNPGIKQYSFSKDEVSPHGEKIVGSLVSLSKNTKLTDLKKTIENLKN